MYSPNGSDASCASIHQSNGSTKHGYKHQRQMYIHTDLVQKSTYPQPLRQSYRQPSHLILTSLYIPQKIFSLTPPPPKRFPIIPKYSALHIGSSHTTCIAAVLSQLNLERPTGHLSGLYTTTLIISCLFSQNTKSSAPRVIHKSVLRRNTYVCGDGQNLTPGDYDRNSERVEMKYEIGDSIRQATLHICLGP